MLIPVRWPKGNFDVDPEGWALMHEDIKKRKKHYSKMYGIDHNEYTYVYGLVKDGEIIYIGMSKNPFKRYMHHLNEKFDIDCGVYVTLLGKGSRAEMRQVERNLIEEKRPTLNKQYKNRNDKQNVVQDKKQKIGYNSNYVNLGPTKVTRVPEKYETHLKNILIKYDVIYELFTEERVHKLMGILEKCLDNEIKKAIDNS